MRNHIKSMNFILVITLSILGVFSEDIVTRDPQDIENELYNQSSLYLKEMEDIFKNESKVLFKEHIENFRLEMENEIHDIEKFIVKEYDTMINAINHTDDTTRDLVNDTKSEVIEKLVNAREHAIKSYQEIKDKLHNVVDNIEDNIENHQFGKRVFDYVKHAFHKIAVLVRLSKKDPVLSGEIDEDEQQKEQQQILQQMPIVNYFPQLSNVGI
ncbi:uncharacterized protein LOC103513028 isoform X1 [Diaphorina citri]|uniref:Uncharacterized protein LOC103513028 isoform X1 n=1 Tax=Diaphorina citri TaxID=121845 RepID=A0A1S4EG84_DIACI|nr:uncharacterized protein LOC103513028 isoform X1 [Diaphorina citri]XP_017301139.2 uncharacterized protein LOC103513028 isoform X1 [Diaphorina citri]KAI5700086.1 hypothetical protein M8J75_013989 [Diaphorina citri]KAI5726325.1 hypothetical protein M8J76_000793 [Diaphorina citri]KAI5731818.1 hypothetical protein M8J77_016540 [Diaphorina citri]